MTLKKALVAITVVAMLFGMVGTAFAATSFPDVTDSKTAAAATRLAALKVVTGYPDGKFGVGDTVTRAQFAAIAVRALGLDSAATYAKGATKFSDVAADYWASGYVNIATQQGIIAGYPDGKFGPEDKVTYAQALTIIVRMLGYAPAVEGRGTWPANYIAKAAQIGFSNGVAFNGNDAATRGNIALFVDSSLTKPMMVETGIDGNGHPTYGVPTGVDAKTLLANNLGASYQDGTLVQSPEKFGAPSDQIKLAGKAAQDLNGASYVGLVGHSVRAWSNADGVFFIEDKTSADSVKSGASLVENAVPAVTGIEDADGNTLNFAVTWGLFDNGAVTEGLTNVAADIATITAANNETTAVLNSDGKIAFVISNTVKTGVVDSISTGFKKVYFKTSPVYDASSLSVDDKTNISGAVTALADIKKNDVVQWVTDGTYKNLTVTRNAKAGNLTKTTSSKVYVDGTGYATANTAWVNPATAGVTDLLGKAVTVLLNKDGDVVQVIGPSSTATSTVAVLTADPYSVPTVDGTKLYVKLLKADGTKATLGIADGTVIGAYTVDLTSGAVVTSTAAEIMKGSAIDYTVDSDGLIDSVTIARGVTAGPPAVPTAGTNQLVDDTYHLIGGYALSSTTPIFDLATNAADSSKWALISRSALETDTAVTATLYLDGNVVLAVVIDGGYAATATDKTGIVAGKYRTVDGYFFTIISGGTSTDYKVSSAIYGTAAVNVTGTVVDFKADGTTASNVAASVLVKYVPTDPVVKVTKVDLAHNLVYINEFTDDADTTGNLASDVAFVVNTDSQVFDYSGSSVKSATTGDLGAGMKVDVYAPAAASGVGMVFVIK